MVEKNLIHETLQKNTQVLNGQLIKLYIEIFKDKSFLVYGGLNAVVYASVVVYLLLTPFVFQHDFNFSPSENAYVYLACSASYFCGGLLLIWLLKYLSIIQIMYISLSIVVFSLFDEYFAGYYLSEINLILSGLTLHFATGILIPVTYTEVINLVEFLPGLLSSSVSATRVILSLIFSILVLFFLENSFSIIPFILIIQSLMIIFYKKHT